MNNQTHLSCRPVAWPGSCSDEPLLGAHLHDKGAVALTTLPWLTEGTRSNERQVQARGDVCAENR